MAAFSTLAMIGIAAGAGMFAGKKAGQKGQQAAEPGTLAAPGPTAATTLNTPPPLERDRNDVMGRGRAMLAAAKQKRKAAGGGQRPMKPGASRPLSPIVQPLSLIGGGY